MNRRSFIGLILLFPFNLWAKPRGLKYLIENKPEPFKLGKEVEAWPQCIDLRRREDNIC